MPRTESTAPILNRQRKAQPCAGFVPSPSPACTVKSGDKLWLTRYALTEGILRVVADTVEGTQVTIQSTGKIYEMGVDLHATWEQAHEAAMQAQRRKIVQLEKQLIVHRRMTFKQNN